MDHIQTAMDKFRTSREVVAAPPHVSIVTRLMPDLLWDRLTSVMPDGRKLIQNHVVAFDDTHPAGITFDILRTRVYQEMQQKGWKSVAITSPSPGCGKTVTALNLAFSLSRQDDCRTLLVDLNLRKPRVSEILGMARASSLEALLSGRAELEESVFRCGKNLAVAPNGQSVQRGAELLQNARTLSTIEVMVQSVAPKFVIYDMPALRPTDDALSFLATVDCAILVLEADRTTREEADLCEIELSKATSVLGVVLNRCRYPLSALEI